MFFNPVPMRGQQNYGELYQPGFFNRDHQHIGHYHGEFHHVTPHHHQFDYLSAYDPKEVQRQDDKFFEDMYGYGERKVHDYQQAQSQHYDTNNFTMMNLFEDEDSNDINFKINEDVEFTLSTSDNYQGRDIQVGVELPDDFDGVGRAAGMPGRKKLEEPRQETRQAPKPSSKQAPK